MSDKIKKTILFLIVTITFILIFLKGPMPQSVEYHNFADQRGLWNINNFGDVISNLPFIFTGLFGLLTLKNYPPSVASKSWSVFFIGVTLVAPGSAWYHLNPNNITLVWDRLPMTIAFMGLFTAMISTYINEGYEKFLLPFSIFFGFASVVIWHLTDDLRMYAFVQVAPLVLIPVVITLFRSSQIKPLYLAAGLNFYIIAKLVESNDSKIFGFTQDFISGHTIKHLSASLAPLILALMLKKVYLHQSKIKLS